MIDLCHANYARVSAISTCLMHSYCCNNSSPGKQAENTTDVNDSGYSICPSYALMQTAFAATAS